MGDRSYDLIHAKWPIPEAEVDTSGKAEIDWLVRLVSDVRTARTELNLPPGARLSFAVTGANERTRLRLETHAGAIGRLARIVQSVAVGGEAQIVVDEATYVLALGDAIDLEAERTRITKAIEAISKERDSLASRLQNPAFVEKAKPEAGEKACADHAEKAAEAERLSAALARLG